MTDIKPNARALMDEVKREHPTLSDYMLAVFAAQRAIERHEAFRQEVSDAVEKAQAPVEITCQCARKHVVAFNLLDHLVIPKPNPDPLVEVIKAMQAEPTTYVTSEVYANRINAALEARGLEIREKSK